jgi:hypothetical protein
MARAFLLLATLLALATRVCADGVDPAELAFWQSISHSKNPAEYQAYLDSYPDGTFAALAKLRAGGTPALPTAAPKPAAVKPAQPKPVVPLKLGSVQVRYIDGIVVDVDASSLWRGSNWRLAVVPANSPDTITDNASFAASSTPIEAARLHVTLPGGPAGHDEVRLYYLSQFGSAYEIAARAPVTVGAPVPNTVLTRELTVDALAQGPIRFAAEFSDKEIAVEGQFLGVEPAGDFDLDWAQLMLTGVVKSTMLLRLGTLGVIPDANGSTGEVACSVDASDSAVLNRAAAFGRGDLVVVIGHPLTWRSWASTDPVLLEDCRFAG